MFSEPVHQDDIAATDKKLKNQEKSCCLPFGGMVEYRRTREHFGNRDEL